MTVAELPSVRDSVALVAAARQALGPVGVFLSNSGASPTGIVEQRAAIQRLEELGYGAAWNNEGVGGRDAFVQLSVLLAATRRIAVGSAIANVWAREPETAEGAAASLAEAYPDRFVLGLGVGYPHQADIVGRPFGKPLAKMREYVERMDRPKPLQQYVDAPYARVLAANGPRMLALAAEIADGAVPTVVPPAFTANARAVVGPDKLLVVGVPTFYSADAAEARAAARATMSVALSFPGSPYAANLARLGFEMDEITAAGDRVLDALAAHGDASSISAKVAEHHAAGADHVMLIVMGDLPGALPQYAAVAPAVLARRG